MAKRQLAAVKTVGQKLEQTFGMDKYGSKGQVFRAFADCHTDVNNVEAHAQRNLNFFCVEAFTIQELRMIIPKVIPGGYNDFDPIKSVEMLAEFFGEDADYFIAREGSPAIYVKPRNGALWFDREAKIKADEFSYDASLSMFRVWWD